MPYACGQHQHEAKIMRKTLELVGLGTLAVLYWITWAALNGTDHLPDRIPTHFDISGNPNAWGSPKFLLFLPVVATGVYLLITVISAIPATRINLPVRVTPVNLPFIQQQTRNMIAWIKAEMACLFVYVQWSIIQAARNSAIHLSRLMVPLFLVCVFGTVGAYLTIIVRGAKNHADAADPC
jgi:uncharacterized membrane protein